MAWIGNSKGHSEAAHKAWKTKRKNAREAAAKKEVAVAKARRTRAKNASATAAPAEAAA